MRLTLASTSPARKMLLEQAGVQPLIVPSRVDEDWAIEHYAEGRGLTVADLAPADIVLELARRKALDVAERPATGEPTRRPSDVPAAPSPSPSPKGDVPANGLVLGGDSMFEFDGVVHGKPHEPEVARARWLAQRGRTGTLWSGHWLVERRDGHAGRGVGAVASATVTFVDDLGDDELDAYIASGEPLKVAGAFTIDSLGGAFIERIEGDPSTVVGMSLPTVRRLARDLGVRWTDLWTQRS
ncbi:Maf-like protein [Pseudoclavibacter endophyticus]|uniref:Nucleoside triphosphate pyrophosphatase n=1 Tax=Pseudoclavibacter endophyticus TaxID=1778590 RepID=A0A6H9WGQ9_9MICO|nr:nucleoside triphosphate pyrophosphatase [Pseudoclavibacter endophyticus]KAB1648204.1 septum formation inhibitor Maf [Pseudoclavibacter endophyticus]GGA70597.1 Maf-like protein [Pseudoclavibacter endophyticus]